jgi:hypothetical protein
MADPIEAHYTPDGDDWTVAVTGRGRTLTGRAPGLIAARDRADQLVEQLAPEESGRKTVVHLLNGDAVEFTTAYLTARLARTEEPAPVEPAPDRPEAPAETAQETAAPAAEQVQDGPPAEPDPAGQDAQPAPDDSVGTQGPIDAVLDADQGVPAPVTAAEGPPAAHRPTPRPRAQVPRPVPAPTEETAPSGC